MDNEDSAGFQFEKWINQISVNFSGRVCILNPDIISGKIISSSSRIRGQNYTPHFTPQFTLQHPIEYSIFLYFGLFGGKGPRDVLRFVDALPLRDLLLEGMQEADSSKVSAILNVVQSKNEWFDFFTCLNTYEYDSR